jgi:hypothetical protein
MDGLFLLAECAAIAHLLRRLRRAIGLFGGASFACYHLSCGPDLVLQRDYLAVLPLVLSAELVLSAGERRRRADGLAGGAMVGVAVLFKPTFVTLACAWPLLIFALGRREPLGQRLVRASCVIAGVSLVLAAAAAVLVVEGALGPFVHLWTEFNFPVYNRLRVPGESPLLVIGDLRWRLAAFSPLVLLTPLLLRRRRYRRLTWVASSLLGVSVVSLVVQHRGWLYHACPLAASIILLGMIGLDALLLYGKLYFEPRWFPGAARALGVLVALALLFRPLRFAWTSLGHRLHDGPKVLLGDRIAGDLRPFVSPGDRVQCLDMTAGGMLALLETGTRLPTKYMYGFSVLADLDTPFRARAREDFMRVMVAEPPKVIVLTSDEWPSREPGYLRLERWPELRAFLDARYALRFEWPMAGPPRTLPGYRGWVRIDTPREPPTPRAAPR